MWHRDAWSSFGAWEGMLWSDIEQQYPDQLARARDDGEYVIPGGGESRQQCLDRIVRFLEEYAAVGSNRSADPAASWRRAGGALCAPPHLVHATISIHQKMPAAIHGNGSSSARAWPKNSASSHDSAVAK
jgi:hypothetical protein